MIDDNKLKKIYSTLQQGGYSQDFDSFKKGFTGNNNYSNRKQVYDLLSANGAQIGNTYKEFMDNIQKPKAGKTPMTAEDRARFSAGAKAISASAQQTMNNVGHYNKLKQQKQKQQNDFGRVNLGTKRTPFAKEDNVVKDEFAYNPTTGETGTYLTSDNQETDNLYEAQGKQAAIDEYNKEYQNAVDTGEIASVFDVRDKDGNYDLQENIGKDGTYLTEEGAQNQLERKLDDAYARKKEIEDAIAKDNQENGNPLLSYSGSIGAGNGRNAENSDYRNKLATSLALVKEQIGALEAVKQYPTSSWGEDAWKALDNTAFTAKTWDFGLTDFAVMGQMERIKAKMDNKIPLTDSDKMLLKSKLGSDAAAALEDEKMGYIYRWTKIAGQSLPFMLDFFLTGGYSGAAKTLGTAALKYAAKRGMGTLGKNVLKYTGVTVGNIVSSYAMAGTEQAFKTGADIMQRHLGTLYQDENGNYGFGTFDENGNLLHDGGESMGSALYKGLTSAMVENYTEKFFHHTHFKRFLGQKMAGTKLGTWLSKVGTKGWYANSKNIMKKFGIDGFGEEVMEEEIGIPLHALLDGDNKMSDLLDPKQQLDIVGGMALSVGSMALATGGGSAAVKGTYRRGQYYRFKHLVDVSDNEAQQLFTDDAWEKLKEQIDNTTNEKMGGMLYSVLQSKNTMSKEQIDAAVKYGVNLMKMRGYNLASTMQMQARETTNEPTTPEEEREQNLDDAYSEGHNAEGADTHTIQLEQNESATALAGLLDITEEKLHNMSDDELDAMTGQNDQLDEAIYAYQSSTAKYQGVMDNANDKVDMAARRAAIGVDQTTDLSRGSVRNATIKATKSEKDYGVYIISGHIATNEDGTINIADSDKMILYYDPKTGRKDYADASRFASLGEEVPADQVKAQAVADAKEKAIKEVSGIIDGRVEEGSEFTVTDEQGNEHTYEVLADNGDGTAMITIDGNVEYNPYSLNDLQLMKDAEDKKRLEAAKAEREQYEQAREQQKKEKEQAQVQDDEQLRAQYNNLLDNDGKVVMGTVHDGKHDDLQAFIIGVNQSNKKPYVVFLNEDGSFTKPRTFKADQVERGESVDYETFKAMMPSATEEESSNVEDDRGEDDALGDELPPVPDNVTINGDGTYSVDGERQGEQESSEAPSITLSDGTIVPIKEDGNPDFSRLTAEQTAELYDTQFGDDADQVINGWVEDAKKALDKATNMTVKGKNFVEQKASKEAKDKAIADAQAAYDSATAIRDAYKERQIAQEENTAEGRKNLIEKARRKYNRLKASVKDNTQATLQLYQDTIGSLLHRLYDGTGIDVFDDTPNTVDEYVASSVVPYSLNYEGNENSKGVQQETGLSRSDFAKLGWLAANGKGATVDAMVHKLWDNRPSNLENVGTQEIRSALLNLITSGQTAFESRNYIQNNRIAQAENILEEQERAAAESETENTSSENTIQPAGTSVEDNTEVPADATDEKPLGEQQDSAPFSARKNAEEGVQTNREEDVEDNRVENIKTVDYIVGKKMRKTLERIAKMMGAKIQWQYSDKTGNGWYDANTNTIYLALDSSITEGVQFIFGHEVTHEIKSKNPEAYEELKTLVKDMMGEDTFNKQTDATQKQYNDAHIFYIEGRPAYEEEVVADQIGHWLEDLNYAHTLAMKMSHPLLAKLHEILNRIKMAFTGTEYTENAKNIMRSIEQAYVKTAKREAVNTAIQEGESGWRFSLKEPSKMSDEEKAERGIKLIESSAIDVKSGVIKKKEGVPAGKAAKQWWEDNVGKSLFYNTEVGKVEINDKSIKDSLAHRYSQAKLDAITSLPKGFDNAVYLGTMKDFTRNGDVKNHYFAYPINYEGKRNYVFCRAMQDANKNRLYVHEVFVADKINEGNTLQTTASQPHGGIALYRDILANILSAAKIDNSFESSKENAEKFSLKDQEYLKAVEDGDMDKAQKMVNEAAEAAGYSTDSSYQGTSAFNGSAPWGNGYFLTKEERKEAWDNEEFDGESTLGDYINDDIDGGNLEVLTNAASYRAADPMRKEAINNVRKAIQDKSKTITMYRSVPANVKEGSFRNGDWITPSRSYAVDNAQLHGWGNDYNIIEQEVPVDDVWFDGNDIAEWGYGREENYINDSDFAYKNTKNNRKQLDAVTYDDNGNVIPLSQRFNPNNADTRYSLKEVNDKFNDRLEELIKNPNQKDKILRLGHASTFLQDGGIADADIELEFDKLKRKAKQGYAHEHPFDLTDVKDLPLAIANPISVFDNTNGRNDGQVILTELKKGDSHFIVAIQTEDQHRKGGIILQVNKIATLFPKDAKGIVNWFIQGKATNVDKEKALHYIEALQNHPGTTISSEELETAAKIIKDYESSKENREKFSLKDEKTLVGVHNITEDKLRKALKLGGFANPSVAIIDTGKSAHNSFGEISFIAPSALVDKKTGGTAGTWTTDAYTQRYPSVERQMSDKGYRKFVDWVDSLDFTDSEKTEIKRQTKDALESNGEPAWELMYLREKGIDIKGYNSKVDYLWQNIIEEHPSAEDILESMKSDPKLNNDVTGLAKSEIISPIWRNISQEVRAQVSEEEGRMVSVISPKVRIKVKEIFERDYAPKLLNKDGSPKKSDVKKVVSQIVQQYEDTKTFSFQKSKVKASSYVHNNGLYTDYLRWQENKLDEFGTTNRLFRGYKNDGTRKYIPETLENVSKAMKSDAEGQTNGSEYTSFGSFIAKVADRVDSTDEMRANKDKLASNEDKQNFYEKWEEVYYDLAKSLYNDVFAGEERLHDIVTKSDPKKYAKKEYGITLTAGFMKKLDALKKAVRDELKSNYFETKFERPVHLNEFAAAVVPNNLGADVRKSLEESGLRLYDYDANKEGDRKRAFNEAVNSSDNIRFSLAGVRGAANLDKADEVTTRLDNLNVARQMEEAKKDAKAIKMATGWERGADDKWRYEMPDAKMKDTIDIGGGHIVKRSEDGILWTGGKLGKYVDAPDLFKAYPQLKDVRLDTDEIVNDMPDNGAYNPKTNTITIHATEVKYLNSILNHEIQHAIQYIEGFAKGGSPKSIRSQIQGIIDNETDASDYAKQKLKRYATLQMQAARLEAYKIFVKSDEQYFKDKAQEYYWDAMNELDNDENSKLANEYPDDKTAKEVAESGYHVDEAIKELKRLGEEYKKEIPKGNMDALEKVSKLTSALKDKSDYELYQALAGEVEARNVQKRLGMTDEERRNSLASETEDVAREDQIFLGVDNNDIRYSLKDAKEDRIQKLLESKPVEITGKEITPSDDLKQYKKNAKEYGKTLQGTYTNEDTGVKVQLQRGRKNGGVNEVLQHDYKDIPHLQSVAAIPQIIRKSIYIGSEENTDKEKNPAVSEYQYYVCGLKIGGTDYTVRSVFAMDDNGNRYYDHKLTDIEKGKLLDLIDQGVNGSSFDTTSSTELTTANNSVGKDKKLLHILQTNRQESPENSPYEQKFSLRVNQYQHDLDEWKKNNNLPKDAKRPSIPVREPSETAAEFAGRVKEYRKQMALWKTAPQYEDHLLVSDTAQGEFNRELQRGAVLARIALQDSMLAVRKAQEAIMHEVGVDKLNMAEDAYTAENRSHGKGKNEFEEYNNEFLQPLRKAYNAMMKKLGKSYDNVKIYMIAKHGLERNAHMAFMKALDSDYEKPADRMVAYNAYKGDMDRLNNDADFAAGRIDFITWRQRDNAIRTKYAPSFMDYRYDKMGIANDYSGLSALFEGSDFEEAAADMVKDVESKNPSETQDLWDATHAATKKILRDSYKAGMMTKDVYEYVRGMYQNYIPLRGWGDTNADQVWNYMGGGKGAFNQTLKKANGRGSLADDPIAYIENMAESGILINNKNWVKQHLLLLAQNHPTSLLNVSKAWYIKTVDARGNEEWIPASPNITDNMTSQQVEAELEAFEKRMEQMKQNGDATQKREHLEISYPQTNGEKTEHEVRVMKDGEEYVIYINGDPQLAQAMNNTRAHRVREGLENSISQKAIARLGRFMAAAYTSLSPLFIPSNYARDLTMTLASSAIREDARYNYLLRKNLALHWNMYGMVRDYQSGKLREKVRNGNATKTEQMFYDYMMNGGETGFVSSMDVEALKKKFKNELKDMNRMALNPKKVGHLIMDEIETLNRAIEGSNRFAVYRTSIEYGRSIEEAVNNAKDVTLNFNRKGTGEHGWQTIRNLYLFINPAVQSLQTLGALAKHHPFKFTAVTTAWLASGVLVPIINGLAMSMLGGDDDKDKYWSFTKWDRRNNMILWVPGTHEFIKIPLAQEFRGFYGVGDMIASKMMGGEKAQQTWEEYAEDMMGQVIDMLPLDPTGYDGNVAVSLMPNPIRPFFELAFNVDFTGKPLFKQSEYNKYDPNFTKAYAGTPDWLVRISRMVNSVGNDYPDFQQNAIDKIGDPRFNLNNPAVVDHILSSYLGGAYTMGSQILGVATKLLNGDEVKVADVPLVSKFVSNPDDRPVSKKQGDEFWTTKERHDRAARTLSQLKKKAKVDGDYSTLEVFFDSDEYKQYKKDDAVVKKYQEDKKAEAAKESGDEYTPKKLTADKVYGQHATPNDDFEDLMMSQLYTKANGYRKEYEANTDILGSGKAYYEKHADAIQAAEDVEEIRKEINGLKKNFLSDDGKDIYNAEDMNEIRNLRTQALTILKKVR